MIETKTLERLEWEIRQQLSGQFAGHISSKIYHDQILDTILYQVRFSLLGHNLRKIEEKYPSTGWDILKKSLYGWLGTDLSGHWPWLGDYLRKKHPIRYTTITLDAKALYPLIAFPREAHTIQMVKKVQVDSWRDGL